MGAGILGGWGDEQWWNKQIIMTLCILIRHFACACYISMILSPSAPQNHQRPWVGPTAGQLLDFLGGEARASAFYLTSPGDSDAHWGLGPPYIWRQRVPCASLYPSCLAGSQLVIWKKGNKSRAEPHGTPVKGPFLDPSNRNQTEMHGPVPTQPCAGKGELLRMGS